MPLCSSSKVPISENSTSQPRSGFACSAMERATKDRPVSMLPKNFNLQQVCEDNRETLADDAEEEGCDIEENDTEPVRPLWKSGSDDSAATMIEGSGSDGDESCSSDRGYIAISTVWADTISIAEPKPVWSSGFISAGEGWEKQTGVLVKGRSRFQTAKSMSAIGAGGVAAAGLVMSGVAVGIALAGTGVYLLRSRHLRMRDKLGGFVYWIEWHEGSNREIPNVEQAATPASHRGAARREYVSTLDPGGKPMPLQDLSLNTAIQVTLNVPRKGSGFLTCIEIFNDGDYNGAQLQLIVHKGTGKEPGEVNLFMKGVLARGCSMDPLINHSTLTEAKFANAESRTSGEYNFWIAVSKHIVAVGFGKIAFKEVRYMFLIPDTSDGESFTINDKLQYRMISHKMRHNLELSGSTESTITVVLSEVNFQPEWLQTSLTKQEAATVIIF